MLRIHGFLIAATALFAMMSLEVCSDEVIPHFRFNGKFLRNNSWLELSLLSSNNTLQCMTDVTRGVVKGSWTLPNGTRLSTDGGEEIDSFTIAAGVEHLALMATNLTDPSNPELFGVYECSIDTTTAQGVKIYIGLYDNIPDNVVVEDNIVFSGGDLPSLLTCVSRNRPATTVQWRYNGTILTDVESVTVLNDPLTAHYTHTLTLNERVGGEYSCTVNSNDEYLARTLTMTVAIHVEVATAPRSLSVEIQDRTTVQLFWVQPQPLGSTISYRIEYTGPMDGSKTVEDASITSDTVSDLQNGGIYFFSISGTSAHFDSDPHAVTGVKNPVFLVAGAPELTLSSTATDSVTLAWTVPSGSVVDTYKLVWRILGTQQPLITLSDTVPGTVDSYTITKLDTYDNVTISIRVTAVNTAGTNSSVPLTLHSDVLRRESTITDPSTEPENETVTTSTTATTASTEINTVAIIAGAVGFLLAGVVIGIVAAFIVSKVTQNCGKRHHEDSSLVNGKPPSETNHLPPANQPVDNGSNSLQYAHNIAYADISNDTFTYDYIDP